MCRGWFKSIIKWHLINLTGGFNSMIKKPTSLVWSRELLDVLSLSGLQMQFDMSTLTQFWVCVKKEHPELAHILVWGLFLYNDSHENRAKKQKLPGKECDHYSCLPVTKNVRATNQNRVQCMRWILIWNGAFRSVFLSVTRLLFIKSVTVHCCIVHLFIGVFWLKNVWQRSLFTEKVWEPLANQISIRLCVDKFTLTFLEKSSTWVHC